jgi:membrane-associated phospholipid phosphatase
MHYLPRMHYLSRMKYHGQFRALALAALALVLAHLLDGAAFRHVRLEDVYQEDWGRLLRVMGFVPTWLLAAAALALHDATPLRRLHRARAGLLILAPALAGGAAELVKLAVRRLRPGELGEYVFRPWTERTWSTGGLGLASSHAAVAFGAATVLSRMFPHARAVWWALAWGCAFTRVAAGAHFLSDVVAAAVLGWLVGVGLWRGLGHAGAVASSIPERSLERSHG